MKENENLLLGEIEKLSRGMTELTHGFGDLKQDFADMKQEIGGMKQDITNMKQDIGSMKQDIGGMKQEIGGMKQDIGDMKQELGVVKQDVKSLKLHIENETDRNIQLLAENHLTLIDKLNQAIKVQDKNIIYELKVNTLAGRVDLLEKDMAALKKAAG